MSERRYDEKEVGAILRRAAEIQEGIQAPDIERGCTLLELEAIGREVGLDPQVIREAVRDVAAPPEKKMYLSGAAGTVVIDEVANGILSDESWEEVLLDLRKMVGRPGADRVKGNKREWTGGYDIGSLTLTVISRGGNTHIRLHSETSGGIGLVWLIGGLVTLFASIFAGKGLRAAGYSWWLIAGLILAILLTAGLIVQSIVRAWDRRNRPKLHALVGKIRALAGTTAEQKAAEIAKRAAQSVEVRP